MSPEVSVVLCTWNRARLLAGALDALLAQGHQTPHEILVVDNGSTDDTAEVIGARAARHPQLRRLEERRQGLAFARNAAIAAARAPIVAFTDDDVRVPAGWIDAIGDAFARYPDAACIGGPVLPMWPGRIPRWLTTRHWAPLGVQDYGPRPLRVDPTRPLCLIGANVAFRREALEAIGRFDPALQRVRSGIGSTEDHEYHLRLWQSGRHGVYEPAMAVNAVVERTRVRKRHHRAWHLGHGRHVARMRLPEIESTRLTLLGVPGHLMRQTFADAAAWVANILRLDGAAAFEREVRLWFAAGFVLERWR